MITDDKLSSTRPGLLPKPDPARHSRKCEICHHPDRASIDSEFVDWHHPDNIVEQYDLSSRSAIYRHAHATGLYDLRRRNLRSALELVIQEAESTTPTPDAIIRAVRAYSCLDDDGRWTDPPQRIVVSRDLPTPLQPVLAADVIDADARVVDPVPIKQASARGDAASAPAEPNCAVDPACPGAERPCPELGSEPRRCAVPSPEVAPPTSDMAPASSSTVRKARSSRKPRENRSVARGRRRELLIGTLKRLEILATPSKQTSEVISNRDKIAPPPDTT